jgi:hypothetical protein
MPRHGQHDTAAETTIMYDNRTFRRIDDGFPVELLRGKNRYRGALRDVSLEGALVRCPELVVRSPRQPVRLVVFVPSSFGNLTFDTAVVYANGSDVGLRFTGRSIRSVVRLRRLLVENGNNPVENRRRFYRMAVDGDAVITVGHTKRHARIIDLSMQGLLAESPACSTLDVGTFADITLTMTTGTTVTAIPSALVYIIDNRYGFRFRTRDLNRLEKIESIIRRSMAD